MPLMPVAQVEFGNSGDLTVLSDTVLPSDAANFDVSGIDGGYRHLRLIVVARSSRAAQTIDFFHIRFNNDSGNNYDTLYTQITTGGSSYAQSGIGADTVNAGSFAVPAASSGAGCASQFAIDIDNYAQTTFHKLVSSEGGFAIDTGDIRFWNAVGKWRSTAAINRITLTMVNANFLAGSSLTVYGAA